LAIAVDTNILLDVLLKDEEFFERSSKSLALASEVEGVVVCEPVYAELMASARGLEDVKQKIVGFLDALGATLLSSREDSLEAAGEAYFRYVEAREGAVHVECASCGEKIVVKCTSCGEVVKWRPHIASDFIIGGHAQTACGRIITRDKSFYNKHFPKLRVYTPIEYVESSAR